MIRGFIPIGARIIQNRVCPPLQGSTDAHIVAHFRRCDREGSFMNTIKKHAPVDATTESLSLIARKIDAMDRRQSVTLVEHGTQLKELTSDVGTLKGDVSTLKGDVSTLKGDVSTLKGDVSTLKGDVSTLKGDVSTLKGDVKALKGDVSTLKQGQVVLMDNQVELRREMRDINAKVDALLAHFGVGKSAE